MLATGFVADTGEVRTLWEKASIARVIFCSARIAAHGDPHAVADQDAFFEAVKRGGYIDHLELGRYVARVKHAPLAIKPTEWQSGPQLVSAHWPLMVQDAAGEPVPDARFVVSYLHNEEKGSDVNIATHLLHDTFESRIDAAVVFSNDTDLKLPIEVAANRIPVGVVNPSGRPVAGELKDAVLGNKGCWYFKLPLDVFTEHQMPDQVGDIHRPAQW
ncbi:PIN domain-containing protein [Kocuria soli]|uniref:NYN domain-containing protein n=1 Tax=Kocuria soli TaxID=2485125 RepID=UPI000F4F97CF|nr:NYN domain-containing protein [Kocuria soli]